jgi:hypothetical protein
MAANIKFKRTSTTTLPTGLTFAEPAFVLGSAGTTTANQLYIGDNSGGRVWIGAKIENTVSNWTGTEANSLLATQQAIDARITSRISTSGGFTFAATSGTPQTLTPGDTITIAAGSGISTTAGATDTITVANTGVLSFNGSAGAVTGVGSFNGLTGSVTGVSSNVAGSGINVSGATGNVTITNIGVLSFNGSTGSVTGVSSAVAGTGISVSAATGAVTFTNTGVQSVTGTANQITASGSTGAVTLSLPSAVTMPGSLTVTGDLTVNGTTTTVNSTTVTVQDPIISIGGLTGNLPPASGDLKDRGIVALYRNTTNTAGLTGFFGIDQSTGYFVYVPNATVASEIVSGTPGTAQFNAIYSASNSALTLMGGTGTVNIGDVSTTGIVRFYDATNSLYGEMKTGGLATVNRTYTLPDASGTVVVYGASGNTNQITSVGTIASGTWNGSLIGLAYGGTNKNLTAVNGGVVWTDTDSMEVTAAGTSGNILKSNGAAAPTWIDPTASGFTAFVATNVAGGAQGSLHYQTALNTTGMLSLGTANFVLTAGATAPQWSNPASSGFTAYAATYATNVVTTEQSTGTYYLAFASGANATGTGLSVDATATTPLSYNVATGTLTCVAVDALIDGGAY